MPFYKLMLTPDAYRALLEQGHKQGFIKNHPQRTFLYKEMRPARGVGAFVDYLSTFQYTDNRPPSLIEESNYKLTNGGLPIWTSSMHPKDARGITIKTSTLERLQVIAIQNHIITKFYTPKSLASAALEAICVGYLRPTGKIDATEDNHETGSSMAARPLS